MSVAITLPANTAVNIRAITNAAYLQKVIITYPGQPSPITWQGSGEGNKQIGETNIITPSSSSRTVDFQVNCQYSSDGGRTWQDSSLFPGGTTIGSFNLKVVLSEDHVDQDFNDAVVEFLWWESLG